jgi:hypothetical protein
MSVKNDLSDREMSDQKRRVPLNGIVNDIFVGMTDVELMTKYEIVWASDLYKVFKKLIKKGVVKKDEIKSRRPKQKLKSNRKDPDLQLVTQYEATNFDARVAAGNKLFGRIEICDMTNHACSYGVEIKDISQFGLMIAPIKMVKNDIREFLIKPTHLEDVQTISFLAECRWTDGIRAGLKISSISPLNMRELQELIRLFSFES